MRWFSKNKQSSGGAFLKISQNSQENICARASFCNKVAGGRGVYLWILWNFYEQFFCRTPLVSASGKRLISISCKPSIYRPSTLLKKRLCHRCFPVNFVKVLNTCFLELLCWMLLFILNLLVFPSYYVS